MSPLRLSFLAGGGEAGKRMRSMDWSATPLGPTARWPAALRTVVGLMLASNQPMYIAWGPERSFLYNDHYAPILGDKHPAALGRDLLVDVWPEIREQLAPLVEATWSGEPVQVPRMELALNRNGRVEETHFSFFFAPIREENGTVGGLFGSCNEITEQVMGERRLALGMERHLQVLSNMDEGFVVMDREFRVLEVNAQTERLLGRPRDALVGRVIWELYPDTRDAEIGRVYRQVLADGQPASLEYLHAEPDGERIWFEVRAFPTGEGIAVLFRDITGRRRDAAQAALASERVQLALDAGAIVGTWIWSITDDRLIGDERFARLFGLDPRQCEAGMALSTAMQPIHPDDVARVEAAIEAALAGEGGRYQCEYRVRTHGGSYTWVEANGRVERDATGRPVRFPGVLRDHSERRRAERDRDRATALLRSFVEAVPGVVYAKDSEGRLILGNRGVAELLGVPQDVYLGRTDRELLADAAQAEAVMRNDRRIMESGVAEQIEEEIRLADGTPAWWWSHKAPMFENGEVVGLIGASVDITDRKRIEGSLRLSEQRNALALDVAQLGTWTYVPRTRALTMDARTRQIAEVHPGREDLTLDHLARRTHPDDWPSVQAALQAAISPDGDGQFAQEFRLVLPDERVAWVLGRGQLVGTTMIGTVLDVTERRRMIETLEQGDRRKDEFLAMLAHELRNPLAPIGTAAQLLRLAPGDQRAVARSADIIARQVAHMTQMVDDLLDVSRVTRGLVQVDRAPVDVGEVAAAAVEQAEPFLQSRQHRLLFDPVPDGTLVIGDRHRLVQVVSNLLNNAAKYTPSGGTIRLSVEGSADTVDIRVTDNGIGMDAGLIPHVFDLFTQGERTPDRAQGGLGIGLALVRSIVQLHGGRVSASSGGSGQGSTFVATLPRVCAPAAPAQPTLPAGGEARRRNVLVVDDNVDAATMLAAVLRLLGHHVTIATDGYEALARAAERTDWHAFILDIGMPDMTGHELAQRLREAIGPHPARFIALSGYGRASDEATSRQAGFDHHLVKPADVAELHAILANA
ncbi:PAS domain-containing protein [Luteimonas notoginsengisoli]|uniref:histidine kinase n=1 Tax=Luteimonas notoginsengisoli TaxID=1578200 RepID=A0ABV7UQS0_9GAMM